MSFMFTQVVTVYTMFNEENAKTKSAQKGQKEEPTFEKVGPLLGPFSTEICHLKDPQNNQHVHLGADHKDDEDLFVNG